MSDSLATHAELPQRAADRARAIDDARARLEAATPVASQPPAARPHRTMARKVGTGIASLLLIGTGVLVGNRVAGFVLGGSDHAPTEAPAARSTTLNRDEAAAAYRDLVAPVNAAHIEFARRVGGWTEETSSSDASADAVPFAAALRDAHAELEQLGHEYGAAPEQFDRGVQAIAGVEADLARIVEVNVAISVDDWAQRYDADVAELTDAANALRAELGLPGAGSVVAAVPVAVG